MHGDMYVVFIRKRLMSKCDSMFDLIQSRIIRHDVKSFYVNVVNASDSRDSENIFISNDVHTPKEVNNLL